MHMAESFFQGAQLVRLLPISHLREFVYRSQLRGIEGLLQKSKSRVQVNKIKGLTTGKQDQSPSEEEHGTGEQAHGPRERQPGPED